MKKYLMILSGITAIGIATIANTVNTNISNVETIEKEIFGRNYVISTDITKYDISDTSQTVFLEDLLTIFKELNKIHTEKNTEISLYTIPVWAMVNDDEVYFAQGWINSMAFANIHGLINSDFIEFKNVSMIISNNNISVYLNYKIADAYQVLELFSYSNDNIPVKQENMKTYFEVNYTINE